MYWVRLLLVIIILVTLTHHHHHHYHHHHYHQGEPTGGDEFMANPAWKATAKMMTPKSATPTASKPSSSLSLDWVHGYRGFDCRNNIFYLNNDGSNFLFHAASLSIVQDTVKHKQFFFGIIIIVIIIISSSSLLSLYLSLLSLPSLLWLLT